MYKIFILLCAFSLLGIGLVKFVMDGYIDSNLEKLVVFNTLVVMWLVGNKILSALEDKQGEDDE